MQVRVLSITPKKQLILDNICASIVQMSYTPPVHSFNDEARALIVKLQSIGFVEADQKEVLNYTIPYCMYMYRVFNEQHQYIWLITYDQKFVESVIEIYRVPRNGRAKYVPDRVEQEKRGLTSIIGFISRAEADILELVGKFYPPFVNPPKT